MTSSLTIYRPLDHYCTVPENQLYWSILILFSVFGQQHFFIIIFLTCKYCAVFNVGPQPIPQSDPAH